MELTGQQMERLHGALISAFPTATALREVVYFGLDIKLDTIVPMDSPLNHIVFELIVWAVSQNRVEELLSSALQRNPLNQRLLQVARELGIRGGTSRLEPGWTDQPVDRLASRLPGAPNPPFLGEPDAQSPATPHTNTTVPSRARTQVFISYSHKDKRWLEQLQTHLKPMVRQGALAVWDDTRIKAGADWRDEIQHALTIAKVGVLLVTPNFLASDFVADQELPELLAAAEQEGLRIVWIAVRPSAYKTTPIARYQAVNDPGRPLSGLTGSQRDHALVQISEEIARAAKL